MQTGIASYKCYFCDRRKTLGQRGQGSSMNKALRKSCVAVLATAKRGRRDEDDDDEDDDEEEVPPPKKGSKK